MDRSEFEKLISDLESKLKRAVLRVGLKKIEVQVFLLFGQVFNMLIMV